MRMSFFLLVFIAINVSIGQTDPIENDLDIPYDDRVQLSHLNGKYIPADLDDCIKYLIQVSDETGLEKFKGADEEIIASKLHFGLGKWMMSNWSLSEGSRYSHYLKNLGLSHPDDMVQFTIVSLHRHLNNRDLEVDSRIKAYRAQRLQELLDWQEKARTANKPDTLRKR